MILLLLVVFVLCVWLLERTYTRRARAALAGLPTVPFCLPVVGNLLKLVGDHEHLYRTVHDVSSLADVHSKPMVFWFGPLPCIVLMDPEDVKVVTTSFVEKSMHYFVLKTWLGNGLLTADGATWKHNIKKLAGTFTGSIVGGYQDVFNAQAQKLVDNLKREVGAGPFDALHEYFGGTTLESICRTALGSSPSLGGLGITEYQLAFHRTLELTTERMVNVLLYPDLVYNLTSAQKELTKCVGVLKEFSNAIIAKGKLKLKEMKQNGIFYDSQDLGTSKKFRSFLDILLDVSESDLSMTDEQIRAEVDTIILAGQDTTATTMNFMFLMLGSKKDVQDKVYAEIKNIFGDSKRPVQKEDLAHMPYCEALIYETLRLYPPVPLVFRRADHDLTLRSCEIPKDATCAVNIYGAGRSRRLWGPDAQEFKPERWLTGDLPPFTILAFSYGKRSCIGKRYTMALLKTLLVYCVRELEFLSDTQDLRLKIDVTLKVVSGHLVQVRKREEL